MNHLDSFINLWKSQGIRIAIKRTIWYIKLCIIKWSSFDIVNFLNALRFRSIRIYTSCDIEKILPKSTRLRHPVGIVVNSSTKIGENVQINQNVTIGSIGGNSTGCVVIEDNVTIYSGSVVLGDITLGKGCTIGANSVVLEDVKEGKTVVGAPATQV